MRTEAPHRKAFLISQTRLLDVNVHIADGFRDSDRVMLHPACVRISDKAIARLELRFDSQNPRDVHIRVAADFELEPTIPFRAIACDLCRHLFGRFLRDGAIERNILVVTAPEQFAHGDSRGLAENIPACDVDSALHIRMAFEGGIHRAIELCELTRVFADEMWAEFAQSSAHTIGVGWQIKGAKRTDLAVAYKSGVSLDANNGAVENGDRFSAGPFIGDLVQRKLDSVRQDTSDFHKSTANSIAKPDWRKTISPSARRSSDRKCSSRGNEAQSVRKRSEVQ